MLMYDCIRLQRITLHCESIAEYCIRLHSMGLQLLQIITWDCKVLHGIAIDCES